VVNPGDRVLYRLDAGDAAGVNSRRRDFEQHQAHDGSHKHPHDRIPGGSGAPGYVAHIGHQVSKGQQLPADVVCVSVGGSLCLRVLLPGSDVLWVKNVSEGGDPGQWRLR
jgi:hypothetical protein